MKILAITRDGEEFLYKTRSARKVSARSAKTICKIVNKYKFHLEPGEKWFIYDVDKYDEAYERAMYQGFTIRNGIVTARTYYVKHYVDGIKRVRP